MRKVKIIEDVLTQYKKGDIADLYTAEEALSFENISADEKIYIRTKFNTDSVGFVKHINCTNKRPSFVRMLEGEIEEIEENTKEEENMEEVKKEFGLSDLKTGMIVENRYGRKYLVLTGELEVNKNENQKFVFINNSNFLKGSNYEENLKNKLDKNYDVVKVYKSTICGLNVFLNKTNLDLIWEEKTESIWKTVTTDSLIEVNCGGRIYKRYFSHFDGEKVWCFSAGADSITHTSERSFHVEQCKLLTLK